jgi:tetratricopeptide (TPR) repeat protein
MSVKWIQIALISGGMFLLAACGPETIFLRGGLDTPAHHVANGNQLLENGKYDAALAEFMRAKEQMDKKYAPIYVGIGLAQAHKGEIQAAYTSLETARQFTLDPAEEKEIEQAFETVKRLEQAENPGLK